MLKIKSYLTKDGTSLKNIWDTNTNSWMFPYEEPKYKITEIRWGSNLYLIYDTKSSSPYMYDADTKEILTFGNIPEYIELLKTTHGAAAVKCKDNNVYILLYNSRTSFKLPKCKLPIISIYLTANLCEVCYDTGVHYPGSESYWAENTIRDIHIFDIHTGKRLFEDYKIWHTISSTILDDEITMPIKFIGFTTVDDTTYICDENRNIIKSYPNHRYRYGNHLSFGTMEEKFVLNTYSDTDALSGKNPIVIDRNGNEIWRGNGQGLYVKEVSGNIHYDYLDENNSRILVESRTYGSGDYIRYHWYQYRDNNGYVHIVDSDFNRIDKFKGATDYEIYIGVDGVVYFVCVEDNLIQIYDENWNKLKHDWLIYAKWKDRYNDDGHDSIQRAIKYDHIKNKFMLNIPHAEINHGQTPNNYKYEWLSCSNGIYYLGD